MTVKKVTIEGKTCWQVQHGHPPKGPNDKPIGTPIKTFCGPDARERAYAMHYAIIKSEENEK